MMATRIEPSDDMTSPEFLVVGETRRRRVTESVADALNAWVREWSVNDVPAFSLEFALSQSLSSQSSAAKWCRLAIGSTAEGPQICAFISEADLARAIGLPRHCSLTGTREGIGAKVLDQLAESLVRHLLSLCALTATQVAVRREVTEADFEENSRNRWWAVAARSQQEQVGIMVAMSPLLMHRICPPTSATFSDTLIGRRSTIDGEKLKVEAVLGEADLTVGELSSLAVDDVVVLGVGLHQPGYLTTRSGQRFAKVTLGRVGSKRAVVVTR